MPVAPTLHRIPFTTDTTNFVLLHCHPDPNEPLNLELRATEGTTPFFARIRKSKIATYRHRNFTGTEDELEDIFMELLLRQGDGKRTEGIELGASLQDGAVFIAIRQRIGGILKGIADLKLPTKMDEEMDLFDWAAGSCQALTTALAEARAANARAAAQSEEVEKMKGMFKELERLKQDHEEQLLLKCRDLLNSKKERIRKLQKELELVRSEGGGSQAAVKRSTKEPSPSPEPAPTKGRRKPAAKKSTPAGSARATRGVTASRKRKPVAAALDTESSEDEFIADSPPKRGGARGRARGGRGRGGATTRGRTATKSPEPATVDEETASATEDDEEEEEDGHSDQKESEEEMPPPRKPLAFLTKRKERTSAEPEPKLPTPEPMMVEAIPTEDGDDTEDDEL